MIEEARYPKATIFYKEGSIRSMHRVAMENMIEEARYEGKGILYLNLSFLYFKYEIF
jgi:hypothetical protein